MLDRACAAKVLIYGHVSKMKGKPFQYGRTHYEVRLKSVVNRFPAHRVHHSESYHYGGSVLKQDRYV